MCCHTKYLKPPYNSVAIFINAMQSKKKVLTVNNIRPEHYVKSDVLKYSAWQL